MDENSQSMRLDGNNVDIEREMAEMAKTLLGIVLWLRKSAMNSVKSNQ